MVSYGVFIMEVYKVVKGEFMFLSIIVPVFNVEKYLEKCINSILNMKFKDYEIIFVIGSSSDNSNNICKQYQEQYNNIMIVKQDGTGLSNARNCGFYCSTGNYIMYIDSDDYINTKRFDETIEKFYLLRDKEYDVLISDFTLVNTDNIEYSIRKQIKSTNYIIEDNYYLKEFLKKRGNYWNVWRYVYKRDFLIKNNILSKENYKSEDIEYSTKVILSMKKYCFYHNPYYCYRVGREGSLVNVIIKQNIDNLLEILELSIKMVYYSKTFQYKNYLLNKLKYEYIFCHTLIYEIESTLKQYSVQKISMYKFIYNYSEKNKILWSILKIINTELVGVILFCAKKMRRKLLGIINKFKYLRVKKYN